MNCAWQELLSILPQWLGKETDMLARDTLQELRLRIGQPPELVCGNERKWLSRKVTQEDLNFVINTASRYSPWAAQSVAQGYLTAPGGHRIGICGEAVIKEGNMNGVRSVRSLCIRVARDFPGLAAKYSGFDGSILIIGPPGSGKTTLLRDLIRALSERETVVVVDERGELFPPGLFQCGRSMDVLTGCPKTQGIERALRTMGPDTIAVDEITAEEDCAALLQAGWCGVRLLATVHASSMEDLRKRPLYKPLIQNNLFEHVLILNREKVGKYERVNV